MGAIKQNRRSSPTTVDPKNVLAEINFGGEILTRSGL
jgi:hypothetical protein